MSLINFQTTLLPVPRHAVFRMEEYQVWCSTVVKISDGEYLMLYSRWPQELGYDAWVTHSEVCYATASDPLGPFTFQSVALQGSGGVCWDTDVIHNPTLLEVDGKYYLYYTGNRGNGEYWTHRNNQRIGVAVADHPCGSLDNI
ncbi:hypothetical protein [Paenibacillus sp. FSL H7-0714]|uniref:hypothetical protein n=1 Tax=Paenibacillus sp. FSL H7-0714 TaxID=2954735 RepID=UPI0030F886D5